ncbi:MAG: DUF5985 family protein [Myxococcota bacterium]
MNQFLRGALTMACLLAALFFFRFWRESAERLFLWFGAAFVLLGVSTAWLAAGGLLGEYAYWPRFATFAMIAGAVIAKNRPG